MRSLTDFARRLTAKHPLRRLPAPARLAIRTDRLGLPARDPGRDVAAEAAMRWLYVAQDRSASADGGVARSYSLVSGWSSSYPETTGYIVPTFLAHAEATNNRESLARARRMLHWLVQIQLPNGAFQGGMIDSMPVVPVHFNTGQVLLGLAAGERAFGGYREPMRRAADWLVEAQDSDGCWRKFQSPFAMPGEKTYDTHVAWGLLEAARIDPGRGYAESALANVRWALGHQLPNGWFDKCCLSDAAQPLTHTIGYVLRGLLEGYRYTRDPGLLAAARKTADGVLSVLRRDGFLPGLVDREWRGAADWACLTGAAQIAHCWLLLFQETSEPRYRDAGLAANQFVRRTVLLDGPADTLGGVKGSFPVDGAYGHLEFLSWAAKFLFDSLMLEKELGVDTGTASIVRR